MPGCHDKQLVMENLGGSGHASGRAGNAVRGWALGTLHYRKHFGPEVTRSLKSLQGCDWQKAKRVPSLRRRVAEGRCICGGDGEGECCSWALGG